MKINNRTIPLIALVLLGSSPLLAAAATPDSYTYLGGGIGYSRMNGEDFTNTSGDLTKNQTSWKAYAGMKFSGRISLEGQHIDFGAANRNTDRIQATGWTAGLVLDFLQNRSVTPYAKAGALFWETDNRFNGISQAEDDTDPAFGLGVRFMIGEHGALRTEYERFAMDHTDIDNFSVSLQFIF